MNNLTFLIASVVLVLASGALAALWFAMVRIDDESQAFDLPGTAGLQR